LGSSLGTAIIGSVLVAALTTTFISDIQSSSLPNNIKSYVQTNSKTGVQIVPVGSVTAYAESKGASQAEANQITETYASSQIRALRYSLFALFIVSVLMIPLSRGIPNKVLK